MSVLFVDSCDHYTAAADVGRKYTNGADVLAGTATGGRNSTRMLTPASGCSFAITTPANSWALTFAWKPPAARGESVAVFFSGGATQVSLNQIADGSLRVSLQFTDVGTTPVGIITPGAFHTIRWEGTIHNTLGTCKLWVNGTVVLDLTNVDTQSQAAATWSTLELRTFSPSPAYFEDIVVATAAVDIPALDHRVAYLPPTADGTYTDWAKSSGTAAYALLDEAAPDAADYILATLIGTKQSLTFPAPPAGVIPCLQLSAYLKAELGAGSRQVRAGFRSGTTDYPHPLAFTLGTDNKYYRWIWQVNPATGVAFVTANFPAQFYLEVVA